MYHFEFYSAVMLSAFPCVVRYQMGPLVVKVVAVCDCFLWSFPVAMMEIWLGSVVCQGYSGVLSDCGLWLLGAVMACGFELGFVCAKFLFVCLFCLFTYLSLPSVFPPQFHCIISTAAGVAAAAGFTEICLQSSEANSSSQPGGRPRLSSPHFRSPLPCTCIACIHPPLPSHTAETSPGSLHCTIASFY